MSGYLKLGDIQGESTDDGHVNWINLLAVGNHLARPMAAGASGSTRHRASVIFGDFVCVKEVDASTPKLQEALADGANFPKVNVDLCTSSEGGKRVPFLQWELINARVTSYEVEGGSNDLELPTEHLSLNFEKIRLTYTRLAKDNSSLGKVEFKWSVEEGTP